MLDALNNMIGLTCFYEMLVGDKCTGLYIIIGSIVGALTIWTKHII